MPPAPPRKIETSPRMISQFGVFTSFQANVDANGNNILGDCANEPSISVDPTDGNKMVIAWRQFNSINSDFRQAGWGYTTDGGTTWTFPGVLENNIFRSDPVTQCDETGKFLYLSLQSDQAQSFSATMSGTRPMAANRGFRAVLGMEATRNGSPSIRPAVWVMDFSISFGPVSSLATPENSLAPRDGGTTWMTPINVPNNADTGALDVDTNGNLFLAGGGSPFYCIRSTNAQNGNVTPSFDQTTQVNLGGDLIQGGINGIGLCGQTFVAVDRSGTATNNNVYMLASVIPFSASNGTDVMFARSTDGGATFSAPHRINDDPINQNKWHIFGTLSVAPNGRIDVVWL